MVEQVFSLKTGEEKTIEKVLLDDTLHYLHMILPVGEGLPVHDTNAPVYMTVVRGTLSIALADQPAQIYGAGTLLKIPNRTKMRAQNAADTTLELIVVKAPAPQI